MVSFLDDREQHLGDFISGSRSKRSGAPSGEQFKYFQFVLENTGLYSLPKSIAIVLPNELDFYLWI
jgi:hypothetical protein